LLHLTQHRSRYGVHPTKKHDIRLASLQLGQDGRKVSRFVVGEFPAGKFAACSLDSLLEFIGDTLAVGRAVINDGNCFALEIFNGIPTECSTQLTIVCNYPECGLVALHRVFWIRG